MQAKAVPAAPSSAYCLHVTVNAARAAPVVYGGAPCASYQVLAPLACAEKKEKAPREPSAYNIFMKAEIAKVKKAKPDLEHKLAFKEAASGWATSKQNPKNK